MDDISVIFICLSVITVFIGIQTLCICCKNTKTHIQYNQIIDITPNSKNIQI